MSLDRAKHLPWPRLRLAWLPLLVLLAVPAARLAGVDRLSAEFTDQALQRSLLTFAAARGLNALISVVQGTELAVQPAGVGLTFTPGEVLDPLNDLIERFSWVMLVAGTSLGIQKLLLQASAWWVFDLALAGLALGLLGAGWRHWPADRLVLLRRALALMLALRFVVPAMALGNELAHRWFLAPEYAAADQGLGQASENLRRLRDQDPVLAAPPAEEGLVEEARRWYRAAVAGLDLDARLRAYQEAAGEAVEYAIRLIALFVLQTVALPLLFVWLGLRLLRGLWAGGGG